MFDLKVKAVIKSKLIFLSLFFYEKICFFFKLYSNIKNFLTYFSLYTHCINTRIYILVSFSLISEILIFLSLYEKIYFLSIV